MHWEKICPGILTSWTEDKIVTLYRTESNKWHSYGLLRTDFGMTRPHISKGLPYQEATIVAEAWLTGERHGGSNKATSDARKDS